MQTMLAKDALEGQLLCSLFVSYKFELHAPDPRGQYGEGPKQTPAG